MFTPEENYLLRLRWPDGVKCPKCGAGDPCFISTVNRFKCRCNRCQFTLKTGTVLTDSPVPVKTWISLVRHMIDAPHVSTLTMRDATGITQGSCWLMSRKILVALNSIEGTEEDEPDMNCLPPETVENIILLRMLGKSVRDIAEQAGCSKVTVHRYCREVAARVERRPQVVKSRLPSIALCDHCHERPVRCDSEYYRRTARTKHKFCSAKCYGEFTALLRENDQCIRCGITRKETTTRCFTNGYCQRCHGVLYTYGHNESLAAIHDANQSLKGAISNAKRHS